MESLLGIVSGYDLAVNIAKLAIIDDSAGPGYAFDMHCPSLTNAYKCLLGFHFFYIFIQGCIYFVLIFIITCQILGGYAWKVNSMHYSV